MAKWKDITSYQRGESGETTEPRTWQLETGGGPRLCVTRYVHGAADDWFLSCRELGFDYHPLGKNLETAKGKAIDLARAVLRRWMEGFGIGD
jgi:hypothetical protein